MVYLSIDNLKYKLILKRENEKNRSIYYHTFNVVFVFSVGCRFVRVERGYHVFGIGNDCIFSSNVGEKLWR